MSRDTVVDRFLEHVESRPGDPALWHHVTEGDRDEWVSRNWGEYGRQAKKFAGALVGMGFEADQRISISAYNCRAIGSAASSMARRRTRRGRHR